MNVEDKNRHLEVGKMGEKLAREFLENYGYKIIEQNYRTKYAEIDLIVSGGPTPVDKNVLVFVEVRTKIGEDFGTPEETINNNKKRKLLQNAIAYSYFKKWDGPSRIDAICIVLKPDHSIERLNHYENII